MPRIETVQGPCEGGGRPHLQVEAMQAVSSPINILGKHLGKTVHDIELRAFKQPPAFSAKERFFKGEYQEIMGTL